MQPNMAERYSSIDARKAQLEKSVAILRYILFCVFFAAGVAAMALAILADELHAYCNSKILLTQALERDNPRIERLIADYTLQIDHIQSDPNLLSRLRRVTLGQKLQAQDAAYPQASDEQLKAVEKLFADLHKPTPLPALPQWVERISAARNRQAMFFSGAALILVAFVFFAAPKEKKDNP
jgi:hypothetical protein